MDRLQAARLLYANLITGQAGIPPGSDLAAAFAATPREQFVGPPPWKMYTRAGYVEVPAEDPALLYQDVVVSLGTDAPLNNGQPSLHAHCLAALAPRAGERVVHVGAGTGYYTTLLARLVGASGSIDAYEIEPELAQRAAANLAALPQVTVHARSGAEAPLPTCDILYVNAGATAPMPVWLDALNVHGRLLFPLTPANGAGAMLLITHRSGNEYDARFLLPTLFVPCTGARDEAMARKLAAAFRGNRWTQVRSLHRHSPPDASCWCSGPGWWLSVNALR